MRRPALVEHDVVEPRQQLRVVQGRGGVRRERLGQAAWLARLGWGGALISFVQILLVERGEVCAPAPCWPLALAIRCCGPSGREARWLLLLLRVHRHV